MSRRAERHLFTAEATGVRSQRPLVKTVGVTWRSVN